MIKGTCYQRRSRELITCNGGSMRLLPTSALRAGARRRSTQTEISEARKSDGKGSQHEAKHVRSARCAGSALVKQLDPKEFPRLNAQGSEMTCIRHLGRTCCNFGSRKPKLQHSPGYSCAGQIASDQ